MDLLSFATFRLPFSLGFFLPPPGPLHTDDLHSLIRTEFLHFFCQLLTFTLSFEPAGRKRIFFLRSRAPQNSTVPFFPPTFAFLFCDSLSSATLARSALFLSFEDLSYGASPLLVFPLFDPTSSCHLSIPVFVSSSGLVFSSAHRSVDCFFSPT